MLELSLPEILIISGSECFMTCWLMEHSFHVGLACFQRKSSIERLLVAYNIQSDPKVHHDNNSLLYDARTCADGAVKLNFKKSS